MTTSVAVTPEREEFWAFTQPYMRIPIVIVAHADVTYIADMRELAGKKVAVVDGYAVNDWLPRDFPAIRLVRVTTAQAGLAALQRGEVFAYVENMLVVGYYLSKLKMTNLKIAGETPYVNAQCMAVRKDWATLAGILQKALDSISEAERNGIYRKWLPIRYEHGFNYTLLWQALAICAVIFLGLALWIRKLSGEIRYRRRTEAALHEGAQRFRQLFDVAVVPLCLVNQQGVLVDFNTRFTQTFGYTHADVPTLREWWQRAYPDPDYRRWVVATWDAAVRRAAEEQADIEPIEYQVTCKNGAVRTLVISGAVLGGDLLVAFFDITVRTQAEQALKHLSARHEAILQAIPEIVMEVDANKVYTWANPAGLAFFGDAVIGTEAASYFVGAQATYEQVRPLFAGDATTFYVESWQRRQDGQERLLGWWCRVLKDDKGHATGALSTARDITDSTRAAEALRASEERFHRAVVDAPFPILLHAEDGAIIQASQSWCDITGYTRAELATIADWTERAYGERKLLVQAEIDQLFELDRRKHEGDYTIRTKSGDRRIWEFSSAPLGRLPDGRRLVISMAMDVTEQRQAEEALRRQAERLRNLHKTDQAILQAAESPEAIVQAALLHLRGLLQCECASVGIFDLAQKEVRVFVARTDDETIVQTDKVLADDAYGDLEILRHGATETVEDMATVTSPPAVIRILQAEGMRACINVPLRSAQGLYGVLHVGWSDPKTFTAEEIEVAGEVAAEITLAIEQARLLQKTQRYAAELEQRVTERTAQLKAANQELEAFAYSVSHDLRAPLRAVDGFTRILTEDYATRLDAEGKRVCAVISQSARDMGKLIDDLLAFSRVGRAALQPSAIDMVIMARSIFFELTTPLERDRIDFHVGPLPPTVGDPSLLRQVWLNLLANAVTFSSKKERAVIDVRAEQRGGEIVYAIGDNGAGFDMQYVHKLFGVFQRLHSADEFAGTGVGLAIVQRIVQRHGGRVWAEGAVDHGATFYFTITAREALLHE